jgi:hypothetical protein
MRISGERERTWIPKGDRRGNVRDHALRSQYPGRVVDQLPALRVAGEYDLGLWALLLRFENEGCPVVAKLSEGQSVNQKPS